MNELLKKEEALIAKPIKDYINNTLINGFKTKENRIISKIDSINIINFEIDSEESEIKESISVNSFRVYAKVWVQLDEDATTNNTLDLLITKGIKLSYDFEVREYSIDNLEELSIIDMTY